MLRGVVQSTRNAHSTAVWTSSLPQLPLEEKKGYRGQRSVDYEYRKQRTLSSRRGGCDRFFQQLDSSRTGTLRSPIPNNNHGVFGKIRSRNLPKITMFGFISTLVTVVSRETRALKHDRTTPVHMKIKSID